MQQPNNKLRKLHKVIALCSAVLLLFSLVLCGLSFLGNKFTWLLWFGAIGIGATVMPIVLHAGLYALNGAYVQAGIVCSRILGVLYLFLFPVGTVVGILILLASYETNEPLISENDFTSK